MASTVTDALPFAVVVLPFIASAALATIPSGRIGTLVNIASAALLFVLSCALPWDLPDHLVRLTTFIAMTTSWAGLHEAHTQPRLYHCGFQALVGAIVLALLAVHPVLTWIALVIALGAVTTIVDTATSAARPLLLCGAGLMLALLGSLLLEQAPAPATLFLLLGYGSVAGLAPLHAWLVDAAAEAPAPGALLISVLLPNAPLLTFMHLRTEAAPPMLVALGLLSVLFGGASLLTRPDPRRAIALSGVAMLGFVECGIGLGADATPRLIAMLALARAALLQCRDNGPAHAAAGLTLTLLPLLALYILAEPAAAWSGWLLLPLAIGALLMSWTLPRLMPNAGAARQPPLLLAPVWLQLALVAALVVAP
jgi:NADH:ubiquinone oxidoreductase subunit 2 (subunit N)